MSDTVRDKLKPWVKDHAAPRLRPPPPPRRERSSFIEYIIEIMLRYLFGYFLPIKLLIIIQLEPAIIILTCLMDMFLYLFVNCKN